MEEFNKIIDNTLKELGYETVEINGKVVYCHNGKYYKFTYVESFKGYVLEYANSYEEAENNVFEDGDIYSTDIGKDVFIETLRSDLIKYYN